MWLLARIKWIKKVSKWIEECIEYWHQQRWSVKTYIRSFYSYSSIPLWLKKTALSSVLDTPSLPEGLELFWVNDTCRKCKNAGATGMEKSQVLVHSCFSSLWPLRRTEEMSHIGTGRELLVWTNLINNVNHILVSSCHFAVNSQGQRVDKMGSQCLH